MLKPLEHFTPTIEKDYFIFRLVGVPQICTLETVLSEGGR